MPIAKKTNVKCPVCKEGEIVEKVSKKKKVFYGCSRYPECVFISWDKPLEKLCPKCNSNLSERRFKGRPLGLKCISPDCDYQEPYRKRKEDDEESQALAS